MVEELICVLEVPPGAGEATVGGLNGRGFGDGKYKLPVIRRSIRSEPLLIGHIDLERYQSAWGKPEAAILEAEIPGKLNLGVQEGDRI